MATIYWRKSIQFGSQGDEKAFFRWVESMAGVTRIEGNEQKYDLRLFAFICGYLFVA